MGQQLEATSYKSSFRPSPLAESILRKGKMIDKNETPQQMIERMAHTIFSVEPKFETPRDEIIRLMEKFGALLDDEYFVMSTPIMTNAGRYEERPLSACTVPPVDLRSDFKEVKKMVDQLHADGMGTGFNLDPTEDPVGILEFLNNVAIEGARSGREDRPVGNMAILSIDHPEILEFIKTKVDSDSRGEEWRFNISVNINEAFMRAFREGDSYTLRDGRKVDPTEIFWLIAEAAYNCGDPGLIFLHRLERDNPTPGVGQYTSTAPCAEVGLAPGECCQFGYINLGRLVEMSANGPVINIEKLQDLASFMVRVLDNALEVSIDRYSYQINKEVMRAKRKIGIGICGVADMLVQLNIPYDSEAARKIVADIVACINYYSKLASHELANSRGSFGAMVMTVGNRYNEDPGFIEQKYGNFDSAYVTAKMWNDLGRLIRKTGLLRNASAVALPPTGRSSLVIGASTGIEPYFSLATGDGINRFLYEALKNRGLLREDLIQKILTIGRIGGLVEIPKELRDVYKTALEIPPGDHLFMTSEVQTSVDESTSKTVNLPEKSSPEDILYLYLLAYDLGLKGVTVFRTASRKTQPVKLATI